MRRDGSGPEANASVVDSGGACSQARFSPDGTRLAWVRDGALVVDGTAMLSGEPLRECAEPAWSPGQRSYAWSPDGGELAWCRNESGFGRMVIGAPDRKSARELSRGWHRDLDWAGNGIVCVRSGAVTPNQLVVLAANGSGRRTIARGPVGGFEATGLVEPRPVTWKSGGAAVHGLLWRSADASGPAPTVVHVHGGPTGQALADWNPRVQWLVQHGYTVLQPNHRGSSGYGVAYRNALDGRWGELDVADVAAGIRHAIKQGWSAPGSGRAHGRQRRRFHRIERRGGVPRDDRGGRGALSRHRSPRPRGDDAPIRVGRPRPARGPAARSTRRLPRAFADHSSIRDTRAAARPAGRLRSRRSIPTAPFGSSNRCRRRGWRRRGPRLCRRRARLATCDDGRGRASRASTRSCSGGVEKRWS